MSNMTSINDLKNHPLFTALCESFPESREWLETATAEELVAGSHPDTLSREDTPLSFEEYYVRNIFKKVENLDLGVNPDQVAFDDITEFLNEQEQSYALVKATLSNLTHGNDLYRVLDWVRSFFKRVFKGFNPNSIKPRYTSGATLTLKRGMSVFDRYKASEGVNDLRVRGFWTQHELDSAASFEATKCVTYNGPILTGLLFTPYKHECAESMFYVRLSAVVKQASISRIVGIHASTILAQQVGLGDYLTTRLSRFCNVNLSTAPDLHKELAMEGSLTGLLSTLDQRKASDNILRILCEWLFPHEVFSYMSRITPTTVEIQGVRREVRMMCPAGNGFIFPLQTMLFWALIRGTQVVTQKRSDHWVFGDDVIISTDIYDDVVSVFQAVGLQVNENKSFKSGPFRESCGGDYLYGSNVRPQHVKRIPASTIDWIRIINGIRRVSYYNNVSTWRSNSFRSFWLRCIRTIPVKERIFCPKHYGDSGINSEYERLYRLATPRSSDAEGVKYASSTTPEGYYYNSERIKLLVAYSSNDRVTYSEVSKGVPSSDLLQLLTHPSVKGAGGSVRPIRKNGVLTKSFVYPKVFNGAFEGYREQYVPYTLFGSAPNETDELFEFLSSRHPSLPILDSNTVISRYQERLLKQREILVNLLAQYGSNRVAVDDRAKQVLAKFVLSRG